MENKQTNFFSTSTATKGLSTKAKNLAAKTEHLKARKYADVVPTLDIPKRTTVGEYIMVMHLADGVKITAKTGTVNYSTAKDLAYDGILFVEEEYGPVLFWNWQGEESVIRTVASAFPTAEKKKGMLGKIANFINADDVGEVERIRRRNARKEKFAALMAKVDSFFEFEDDEVVEVYNPAIAEPKTLKDKLTNLFYVEVEEKIK